MSEDIYKELIDEKFKGVHARIDANYENLEIKQDSNHDEVKAVLKQILDQTKKTNGRVTELEGSSVDLEEFNKLANDLNFFRVIGKYPKMAMLAVFGLCGLTIILGLGTIFKIF